MNIKWQDVLATLTNTKVVLAILSQVIIIGKALSLNVDWNVIEIIVGAILIILVNLGIMNKYGMDTTFWDDKEPRKVSQK